VGDSDTATAVVLVAFGVWLIARTVIKDDGRHNPAGKPMNLVDHILHLNTP
jgi:hypothetical protein